MGTRIRVVPRASDRLPAGAPLSVPATDALDIPTHLARQCDLLRELHEQTEGSSEDLQVPLSSDELKAWIECALRSGREGVLNGRSEDIDVDTDKVLKAVKVGVVATASFHKWRCEHVLLAKAGPAARFMRAPAMDRSTVRKLSATPSNILPALFYMRQRVACGLAWSDQCERMSQLLWSAASDDPFPPHPPETSCSLHAYFFDHVWALRSRACCCQLVSSPALHVWQRLANRACNAIRDISS